MRHYKDIIFEKPLPEAIRRLGLLPADMHFHTRHSDSPTRVRDALKLAARRGIGLAITDHNQVGGVVEAGRQNIRVPLVPGVEVSANDGRTSSSTSTQLPTSSTSTGATSKKTEETARLPRYASIPRRSSITGKITPASPPRRTPAATSS